MALDAGVMSITLEFAKDLKDGDWFGKQDPYCIIRVGGQTFRTRTAVDGGKNPVWNETFAFNIINENNVEVEVKDEDFGKDDSIGAATFNLAKAREMGADRMSVPVVSKKKKKQHGFLSVSLQWAPNRALKPGGYPQAHAPMHVQHSQQPPYYPAGAPMPMYAPHPGAAAYHAPPQYYAAPPGAAPMYPPYPAGATAGFH